jgi:hypothetical protein
MEMAPISTLTTRENFLSKSISCRWRSHG